MFDRCALERGTVKCLVLEDSMESRPLLMSPVTGTNFVVGSYGEISNQNKGSKFLKKLWCCVGGEYYKTINLVLSTGLIM